MEGVELLLHKLEMSVIKNGAIPLTNKHLMHIISNVLRDANRREFENDLEGGPF